MYMIDVTLVHVVDDRCRHCEFIQDGRAERRFRDKPPRGGYKKEKYEEGKGEE